MKVICTGDWHIGDARTLRDAQGRNQRLMDFARCARFVIEDGIARGAELILHAGDIWNGPRPTPLETRLAKDAFDVALAAGVPVLAIVGNHDMPRSPAEYHALDHLRDTPGLTIVDRPCLLGFALGDAEPMLSQVAAIEAWEGPAFGALSLQIACLPWPNKSLLLQDADVRKLGPGEVNLLVRERMMDVARALAGQLRPDVPSILLAHCSLDVAAAGTQDRLMMLGGDWTLNAAEIAALGFTYVALGHIHKPQQIAGSLWYSGSPEACTFGEEGEAKQYLLVDIAPDDPEGIEIEQVPTPYRNFITIDAAAGFTTCTEEVGGAIVRLRLPEAQMNNANTLRTALLGAGALEVSIEIERAESQRRAGALEVSHGMEVEPALRAWIAQRPDLEPLADGLVAEGLAIDRGLSDHPEPRGAEA